MFMKQNPTTERERTRRNLNPTPEAVFAMFHWHDRYAAQRGGSMDFYDRLTKQERLYCARAVLAIRQKVKR